MADIVVIGSFVVDMVANVEKFAAEGETILGKRMRVYFGGKGINQAVAARRLGSEVEMVGCLGDDGNGESFLKILAEDNICSDHVKICRTEPTGVAQIQINSKSENKIVVIPSANHEYFVQDVEQIEDTIRHAKLVMLQLEMLFDVNLAVIELCSKYKVPILLNPAPAVKLKEDILSQITYLTPNETELEILTGIPSCCEKNLHEATQKLLDMGVKNVIVTLGSKGAMLANGIGKKIIPGYSVKAIDTVAAGDSFNGAFAKCIVDGKTLEQSLSFANAVGALTVTKNGAIPSLPYINEVNAFIQSNKDRN